ncbi:MAG TPA: rhomboid family intramembrane serine protease, partial [Candidatus Thermoplasmatota archaeon]|nr:rhomboid family intramembrane serine protease [Candidatus Thermoplasmatota archaeon]
MNLLSWAAILLIVALLAFFWVRKFAMTFALIVANVAVFGLDLVASVQGSPNEAPILWVDLAFRPSYLFGPDWSHIHTVATAGFLHAGFFHIFGNMLILLIAGIPFEERIGRTRFFFLYMFSLVAASLLHALWVAGTDPAGTRVLSLGASGAVFGILGGFAATYPRDKFPIFPIPLGFFSIFVRNVPVFIGVLLLALLEGFAMFVAGPTGIANAAHVGGAIAGSIAGVILKPGKRTAEQGAPRRLDYDALLRLAPDEKSRGLVARVKENADHADVQRAWLDR